ncbi:MAG TPA: prolyl oligopeptidase family serine peptidase [Vicinamibacterales bacterium]|nr:prolyl oligopeptidase family serine peptidase [Vicinamibacterales bacterium]
MLGLPSSNIDRRRIAIVGASFGGIVTTLAAAQSKLYSAVVVQAPGSLNWNRSAELRPALTEAARRITVPIYCAVAENDATTESAKAICAAAESAGAKVFLKIYPAFTGGNERTGNAPGHALFSRNGVALWRKDLLDFLATSIP